MYKVLNYFMKKVHLKNLNTIWKKVIFQSLKWPCLYTSLCWHYLSQIENKVKFIWYAKHLWWLLDNMIIYSWNISRFNVAYYKHTTITHIFLLEIQDVTNLRY